MTDVAWRNLVRDRVRLAISVGGVAFAVLLILVLRALYVGFIDQATEYIRSVDADIWVAEKEAPGDFFHSVSLLPADLERDLLAVDGVAGVDMLLGRPVVFEHGGKDVDVLLLGIDARRGIGGPPSIEKGRSLQRNGEIVIDRVFARNNDLDVGDSIRIQDQGMEVVGLARGGNTLLSQFAWTTIGDVRAIFGLGEIVNYYLVRVVDGADSEAVVPRVEAEVRGVQAFSEDEFSDKNTADLSEGFLPILWTLTVIAFGIGTAVIGLTIYTATLERRREYGVMKAIGFTNRRLFSIVYRQSLVAGTIGFIIGVVLTFVAGGLIERALPSFVLVVRLADVALVAAAALLMTVVASFAPVRPVARLDPAQVFRV